MSATIQRFSLESTPTLLSRIAQIVSRVPLIMLTGIFTLISVRYLLRPVQEAAAVGITFSSPGGITVARVGFAGFPLAFAILALACLVSSRRLLAGLYMALTLDSVVMAVRAVGILLDHSTQSAHLFIPEAVLLVLSLIAIRLEAARRHREALSR